MDIRNPHDGNDTDRSRAQFAIAELRVKSNAAILARDPIAATASLAEDYRALTSSGASVDGADAMRRAFARSFADDMFVCYTRTFDQLDVRNSVAAEQGLWRSVWHDHVVSGRYLARWHHTAAGWRIIAEMFVPLDSETLQPPASDLPGGLPRPLTDPKRNKAYFH
jgi:ketosteroid isomerase-like protein